jgi:hypothetical protein
MQKKSKNYWPHGILASLVIIAAMCVYTVIYSLDYPVEMDNYYFESYQQVDKDFDKIKFAKEAFDAAYNVEFVAGELERGGANTLTMLIKDKSGNCDFTPQIKTLLTRPETNRYNQYLNATKEANCAWQLSNFEIERAGRWQFETKISIGNATRFFKYEALSANATI